MDNPNPPPDAPAPNPADTLTAQLATITAERDEARAQLEAARGAITANVTTLRDTLRAANPTIPPDLIDGSNAAELTSALERGRTIATDAVERAKAAAPTAGVRVPAGTGGSATGPADALKGAEKIAWALRQAP